MNYESSTRQKLQDSDRSTYTLEFSPVSNSNGSVRFIDSSLGKERTVGINVDDSVFENRYQAKFPAIIADIIDLAVAIHASDRLAPQNLNNKERHLHVVLPVRHPESLSAEPFQTKLKELLEWATGSQWVFEFQKREVLVRPVEQQLLVATQPRGYEVALWSGGLDALAGLYTRLKMYPEKRFALFGVGNNSNVYDLQKKVAKEVESMFPRRCAPLRLRINWQENCPQQEKRKKNKFSRARGVVFTLLGAACAYLMGQRILCVYENGMGAINLFYRASAVGLDHTRSVHPLTLLMVGDVVSELLGEKFQVQNPFLCWTKAQMCKALAEDGRNDLASLTISCDSKHRKSQQPTQCGYCSSCLLRRQALAAANIEDKTPYIVLHEKRPDKDRSKAFLNMHEQVRILKNLLGISGETSDRWEALTRRFSDLEDIVDRTAAAENLLPVDMQSQLIQLYQTYVAEWDTVESRISRGLLNNA
ncbi:MULTISPECIES: 7-cyano-7-deazaguanine synthase [unclassified Nostoc]|uniref:7-cyano-7-deazaguanine synthase n=1 Tax=unclassified Nostoc TaxID=2593658 RepID=UPI001D52F5F0|nr:7-cyano-7-deazaguanine synthase [Nostoc sp. JL23]MBN3877267.1 7-cyano-7-deazaguanine synthase [Nostoc sp. JL23]